jgi:hypothetical protein
MLSRLLRYTAALYLLPQFARHHRGAHREVRSYLGGVPASLAWSDTERAQTSSLGVAYDPVHRNADSYLDGAKPLYHIPYKVMTHQQGFLGYPEFEEEQVVKDAVAPPPGPLVQPA